jgi:hypothetical protein
LWWRVVQIVCTSQAEHLVKASSISALTTVWKYAFDKPRRRLWKGGIRLHFASELRALDIVERTDAKPLVAVCKSSEIGARGVAKSFKQKLTNFTCKARGPIRP